MDQGPVAWDCGRSGTRPCVCYTSPETYNRKDRSVKGFGLKALASPAGTREPVSHPVGSSPDRASSWGGQEALSWGVGSPLFLAGQGARRPPLPMAAPQPDSASQGQHGAGPPHPPWAGDPDPTVVILQGKGGPSEPGLGDKCL